MKKQIWIGSIISLAAASALAADSSPKEAVKDAAKALAQKSNYSWKTTIEFGGEVRGTTEGKTEKGGPAVLTLSRGDQSTEAVLKGTKGAVKLEGSWQSVAEAAQSQEQGPARFIGRMLQNFKAPAAEAEDLAGKTKDLKLADGLYSGDLTEEGAKELLQFGRRAGGNAPTVSGAKGSVKFWVKDGALSKYEYSLQGTMTINGNDRDVDRKNTVEIKDVGTTKVTVPEEAAKKLES